MSSAIGIHGLVLVLVASLIVFVYTRRPPAPLWPTLFVHLLLVACWVTGDLGRTLGTTLRTAHGALLILYTGVIFVPAVLLLITARFAETLGRPFAWTRRGWLRLPFYWSALLWLVMVTNPWHGQFATVQVGTRELYRAGWYVQAVSGYALVAVALLMYAVLWRRVEDRTRRMQVGIMMGAAVVPMLGSLAYVTLPHAPAFNPTIAGLAVSTSMYVVGIYRTRLFDLLPLAGSEVIRCDPDAILLVNEGGRLLYANPAAEALFGARVVPANTDLYPLLAEVLHHSEAGRLPPTTSTLIRAVSGASRAPAHELVYRVGDDGDRWVRLQVTTLRARRGQVRARSLRFRDITSERRAEATLARTARYQTQLAAIAEELHRDLPFQDKMELAVRQTATRFDAAMVRLWLVGPGDRCESGCPYANLKADDALACRARAQCLHLASTTSPSIDFDPVVMERVPLGVSMAGRIGAGELAQYVTNDLTQDETLYARLIAEGLGLQAYAGLGIRSAVGEAQGVLVLLKRDPISSEEEAALATLGDMIGHLVVAEQAKLERAESEDRYRRLVENAPLGVVACDREGRLLAANQQLADMLGSPSVEATLQFNMLSFPPLIEAGIAGAFRRMLHTGQRSSGEYTYTSNWGQTIDVWLHLAPINDVTGTVRGAQAIVVDITERKRAEEALRETAARLAQSQAIAHLGNWDWDLVTNTMVWSDEAFRIFGREPQEVEPTYELFVEHVHPDEREDVQGMAAAALRGGDVKEFDVRIVRPDGSQRWIHLQGEVEFAQDGQALRYVGTIIDVTERRRAEEERAKLEAQVQHAQKLESLGVLAGGIAHDFNNLLTGIIGGADLAYLELPPGSPARGHIEGVRKSAIHAAELTKQMLAYSGKGRFVVEPLDLGRLVGELAHLLEASLPKGATLRYDISPNLPAVEADAAQMRQVIMNLIINAGEAIEDHSGIVTVSTGVVAVDETDRANTYVADDLPPGDYVFLEVSDTGAGMDPETAAKIFEPFFTTKFQGRGLGLAAVLGIVRGHRGALKVYTEPGRGTTFKMLLPAAATRAPEPPSRRELDAAWRGSGIVLVVDDEEDVRETAEAILTRAGFTVLSAVDGQQGVDVFRAHADDIVLVLLDMTMPRLDGVGAFREIRRIRSDARVILSSGYNEQEATSRFAGKGLTGFLQKPYRVQAFTAALRAALEE